MNLIQRINPIKSVENNNNLDKNSNPIPPKDVKQKKVTVFKTKTFEARESLLTENPGIAYNIGVGVFALFLLRALVDDVFTHGMPFHHTWLIWWNFRHFLMTMLVWTLFSASTLCFFYVHRIWANLPAERMDLKTQWPFLAAYSVYLFAFFYFPLKFLLSWQLNCACSFIITCETTRIAMKLHSYIRENWERAVVLKTGNQQQKETVQLPSVQQFVYFFFCPSFIYRDEYPRNANRSWKLVGFHLLHCFALIEFVNLAFTQYVFPWLSTIDYTTASTSSTIMSLFAAIVPGVICLICLFYGLLHSWLNAFSEAMFFADKQFYLNWWTAQTMAEYYRNWNLVVHDWLYAYIYKDLSQLIGGRRGLDIGQISVFFLSSVFHEFWFGVAFRVFYPVMFLLYFVAGGIFFAVSRGISNKNLWNIALWFNLLIGTGMFVAFYGQEWYARQRCQPRDGLADFLLPRHWSCS